MTRLVLIVSSEHEPRAALELALHQEGYRAAGHLLHESIGLLVNSTGPDPSLILLDLSCSNSLGLEICRSFRSEPRTQRLPIIVLSDQWGEQDRVAGFEAGADDYVVKPFSQRELLLRIRVLIRRTQFAKAPVREHHFADLRMDSEAHRAWVGGAEIALTAIEFKLLLTVFERRGRVQTRERLLGDVWQLPGELATRTVDTHMKRLRQKLGPASEYIETIRGVGYRFLEKTTDLVHREIPRNSSWVPMTSADVSTEAPLIVV